MKDLRDIKNEYGYILRWINGGGDEDGTTYEYRFYLEDVNTHERKEITDIQALEYIAKKTVNAFRSNAFIYENYVELFNILGIEKRD